MSEVTSSGTFKSSLDLGQLAEGEALKLLKKLKFNGEKINKIVWAKDYGIWDYDLIFKSAGKVYNVEVKSLGGMSKNGTLYDTAFVEAFSDDAATKRPHWFRKAHIIMFQNRATSTWYIYNAKDFADSIELVNDGHLTRASDGNAVDSGVGPKFFWRPQREKVIPGVYNLAGFICEIHLDKDLKKGRILK